MIVTTYKCDSCSRVYEPEDMITIADFPRRIFTYVTDAAGNKLIAFNKTGFAETHLCKSCYYALLNWTCEIEED